MTMLKTVFSNLWQHKPIHANAFFVRVHPRSSASHFLFLPLLLLFTACRTQPNTLRLATTTTTLDSGLMQAILPLFEAQANATVEVIGVGTGEALALGQAGDVDVVLVHSRAQEEAFVQADYGLERHDVMVNDFVLLGPADDPAGVATAPDIIAAFSRIAQDQAPFISRGDNSGTHNREMALWQEAGIAPAGDWYQEVGQGMGAALTIAEQQQGYVLSDRGTFIQRQAQGLELTLLFAGDGRLLNPYSVIAVNPTLHADINVELAEAFIDWLTGPEGQAAINNYRIAGQQLFFDGTQEAQP